MDLVKKQNIIRDSLILIFTILAALMCFLNDKSVETVRYSSDMVQVANGERSGAVTYCANDGVSTMVTYGPYISLEEGQYLINAYVETDAAGSFIQIYDNGSVIAQSEIVENTTYTQLPLSLAHTAQDLEVCVIYGGYGNLSFRMFEIQPMERFYNDTFFYCVILLLAGLSLILLLHCKKLDLFHVVFVGGILFSSIELGNGMLREGSDLAYHLARIEGIKDGWLDHQFPVVIYPYAVMHNGYLNSMYPDMFLVFPAILRVFHVSLQTSYKSLLIIVNIITFLNMYFSLKTINKDRVICLLGTICYMCSTYRLMNVYARAALGETIAMAFFPLVFVGIYHICVGNLKYWRLLVLGVSGILQSHIVSAVFCLIIMLFSFMVYLLFCHKDFIKEKRYRCFGKITGYVFLLNILFYIPFLYYLLKVRFDTSALNRNYWEHALNLTSLFRTFDSSTYLIPGLGIGIATLMLLAIGGVFVEDNSGREKVIYGIYVFEMMIGLFLSMDLFASQKLVQFKLMETFLEKVQFPFRFLEIVSVLAVFLGIYAISHFRSLREYGVKILLILSVVSMMSSVKNVDIYQYDKELEQSQSQISKLRGITWNQKSAYPQEWLPEKTDKQLIGVDVLGRSEATRVISYDKEGTKVRMVFENSDQGAMITLPIINYPGYYAQIDGQVADIVNGNNNQISISLPISQEKQELVVEFREPMGFRLAYVIGVLIMLLVSIKYLRDLRRERGAEDEKAGKL